MDGLARTTAARGEAGRGSRSGARLAGRQRGAYAVEFAIVFPVFFALIYGILSFGLVATAQQSLTLAAEDGARASLRVMLPGAGGAGVQQQLLARMEHGCTVAADRASWLGGANAAAASCDAYVRGPCMGADGTLSESARCVVVLGDAPPGETVGAVGCGNAGQQCMAVVRLRYPYGANPLAPAIPGLGVLVPAELTGQASATLDTGALLAVGGA